MTKTTGLFVGVVGIAAVLLAAALIALRSPSGKGLDPVNVVLSIDDNGDCVQAIAVGRVDVLTIKNGQQVQYTTASGSNTYSVSFPPSSIKNTGSPFQDPKTGAYQYEIKGGGITTPTYPSHATVLEYIGAIFDSSILTFPYRSMTIDDKACRIKPGGGVHVDP